MFCLGVTKYKISDEVKFAEKAKREKGLMLRHSQAAFQYGMILSKERFFYGTESFITSLSWPWVEDVDR